MTGTDETLLEHVREAWRNACENGYGDLLRAMKPEELAGDMIAFDDDVSGCVAGEDYADLERRIVAILPQVMQ